jgi:hypothetical protein
MDTDTNQSKVGTLLVVLGMHRSGTSVLARAMGTLGGEFGERLLPPVAGVNDKGFFEDADVNALNAEIMKAAGLDWHAMAPVDLGNIDEALLDRLQTTAVELLREKCKDNSTFVLKDPRMTRLLAFWQPVFACLGVRVVYVIAVRSPISVVRSLLKSHQIPEEKSYILWLAHLIPAIEGTRDRERVFIDYDALMDNPKHELSRVSKTTGLPLSASDLEEFEQEFLESDLRNSSFSASDLDVVRSAPPHVKRLVSAMQRAAAMEVEVYAPELEAAVEDGRRYLDSIAPLLRHEWRLVRHVEEVTPILADALARVEALQTMLRENEERAAAALRESEERATAVLRASEERAAAALRDSEERWSNVLCECETRAARELAIRDEAVVSLTHSAADAHRAILEHAQHLEASVRYAEDLKSQNDSLARQIEDLNAARGDDRRALEAAEARAGAQEAALQRAGNDIAQVFASTSWRITAPLRAFRRAGSSRSG